MNGEFDFCWAQEGAFSYGELLEERLANFSAKPCIFKQEILDLEPTLGHFILKGSPCIDDLTLKNYSNIFGETILYIENFKRLRGDIKLQYSSKLKIFAEGDLYLDDVTFINASSVEITRGSKENSNVNVSPSISCGRIWLANVASPSFYIHNIPSLLLAGSIISCNSFKLNGISKIHAERLLQVLSNDFQLDSINPNYGLREVGRI